MENKLLSKEQYNYMRLVNLVLCKGKKVVQRTFDAEFHPKELHNELNRSLSKLQKLKGKVIKENQWQLLFPNSGKPVSDRFDISLMITLLRNLTDEYKIRDKLPTASDVTVSADLSRIKYYRNTLLHSDDAELSETEFEMKWIDLTEAIIRLGGNDFKHQCSALKEAILNSSVIDLINEVRNDLRSPTLPEGIKVIQSTLIKQFEECEDLIVDTRACKHGIELVNSKDVVIVTGPPGSGKSTILGHICLALQRQADVNLLRTWQKYSADLKKLIDKKTCKLLIAARSYIYNDRGFSLVPLFNNTDFAATLDLLSQNVSLTNRERFQIAEKYIGEDGLRILRKHNLLDKYSFFPLLCKLYHRLQKNLKSCVKIFFSSPKDMMLKELKGFYESYQTVIAVLFIFVALNNKINIDEIPSDNFKELLRNVGEDFETCFPLTRQVLKSQLDRLTNTYVTKSMNSYSLVHETLFDILVFFYGTYKLDLLIEYGHTIVIRDRFNIEHNGHDVKNITELDVKISTEMKQKYFVRLKDEILTKSEREVFSNTQWKCLDCLSSFIEYMTTCPDIVEYLRSLSDSVDSPLFVAIEQSLDPLVQFFLQIGLNVNVRENKGATPLYTACLAGNLKCTRMLLSYNAEVNQTGPKNRSPLFAATVSGNLDIVRLLLSKCCDVNSSDIDSVSPLLLSVILDHFDIFCCLLEEKMCNIDILAKGNVSVLYAAVCYGKEEYCKLLLHNNISINLQTDTGETPLYIACLKGYLPIVDLLLDNGSDPNICTRRRSKNDSTAFNLFFEQSLHALRSKKILYDIKLEFSHQSNIFGSSNTKYLLFREMVSGLFMDYCSPIHAASSRGYTKIVELLLGHNSNPNICNYNGETPLMSVVKNWYEDIVDILLLNGANLNHACTDGNTSLHITAYHGNVLATKKLLDGGAHLDHRNKLLETPLYVAARDGHLGVVKLLLKYNANPNICGPDDQSPLYVASEKGFVHIVYELLENNADPNLYNKNLLLPISIASKKVRDVFLKSIQELKPSNLPEEINNDQFLNNDEESQDKQLSDEEESLSDMSLDDEEEIYTKQIIFDGENFVIKETQSDDLPNLEDKIEEEHDNMKTQSYDVPYLGDEIAVVMREPGNYVQIVKILLQKTCSENVLQLTN